MQHTNWNDLRYLLALKRFSSLSEAARILKVDPTTVSRRLTILNNRAGESLYTKSRLGRLELTDRGHSIVRHIEAMEAEAENIETCLQADEFECSGVVRITSVPTLINRLLVPNLGLLQNQHKKLHIELIPESRNLSLNFREADIALRLARPVDGGADTIAKRVGHLSYAVYGSSGRKHRKVALPWIGYDEDMSYLPTAEWISQTARSSGDRLAKISVRDSETALEAVLAGLGKSLLPELIADRIPGLNRLSGPEPEVTRELWLLTHRSQHKARRIFETVRWIEAVVCGRVRKR